MERKGAHKAPPHTQDQWQLIGTGRGVREGTESVFLCVVTHGAMTMVQWMFPCAYIWMSSVIWACLERKGRHNAVETRRNWTWGAKGGCNPKTLCMKFPNNKKLKHYLFCPPCVPKSKVLWVPLPLTISHVIGLGQSKTDISIISMQTTFPILANQPWILALVVLKSTVVTKDNENFRISTMIMLKN